MMADKRVHPKNSTQEKMKIITLVWLGGRKVKIKKVIQQNTLKIIQIIDNIGQDKSILESRQGKLNKAAQQKMKVIEEIAKEKMKDKNNK